MATLDGLNIIEADEVDSSVITFNNYLNGISPTIFNNISGTTSNIQLQLNNLSLGGGTYTSNTGFKFNDMNRLGFQVADNTNANYFAIFQDGQSTITTPVLNLNAELIVNSYNYTLYPTITLNQRNFRVFCDQVDGSTDYVGCYVPLIVNSNITSGDITCTNITNATTISSNYYQRNLNADTGGNCYLFNNATLNDYIVLGSSVSTTTLLGQAVNINSPLTCSLSATFNNPVYCDASLDCNSTTTFNSTAYFNSPIIGHSATFSSLSLTTGLTVAGSYGVNTEMVYLNNTSSTSNCYANIAMSSTYLNIDAKNGLSGEATSIYFNTTDTSNMSSNTMVLQNTAILLNNPTTFTGLMTSVNGLTFSNSTASNNVITGLYKLSFDNNYGGEKILFYNNGNVNTNYSAGVQANTLYFNSPQVHCFYINGINTTPVISMTSTASNFSGQINCPILAIVGVGTIFTIGNLLTGTCLSVDLYGNLNTTGKLTSSGGLLINGASGIVLKANGTATQQNLVISSNANLPTPTATTGICNIQIGNNIGGITTGNFNTCLGQTAGPYITTGGGNVAIGYNALYSGTLTTTMSGVNNTTCIGSGATITNIAASGSTAIGNGANNAGANSTALGFNATSTLANQIMLGTATETVYCSGNPSGGNTPNTSLVVASNITLGSGSVIPTTGQIGNIINGSAPAMTAGVSNAVNNISNVILTAGTWILNGQVAFQSNAAVALAIQCYMVSFSKSGSTAGMAQDVKFGNGNNVAYTGYGNLNIGQYFSSPLSQVIQITTTTTFSLSLFIVYTGTAQISNIGSYFYGTRIA